MTRRREPGPLVGNQRLQEVCDQIDTLDACLDALIRAARSAPLAGDPTYKHLQRKTGY